MNYFPGLTRKRRERRRPNPTAQSIIKVLNMPVATIVAWYVLKSTKTEKARSKIKRPITALTVVRCI